MTVRDNERQDISPIYSRACTECDKTIMSPHGIGLSCRHCTRFQEFSCVTIAGTNKMYFPIVAN